MATDVRPVFPKERLLIAVLLNDDPEKFMRTSMWALDNRYFINGKPRSLSNKKIQAANPIEVAAKISAAGDLIGYNFFERDIKTFVELNHDRLNTLISEANDFISSTAQFFDDEHIVISFSGGKDSTVTADLVINALSNPSLVHIFSNTTLEFDTTLDYVSRYRRDHPRAIFQTARNIDQNFFDVCADIGPPARMMRWCCSMFKTGPLSRVLTGLYRNQHILTFYGIRKSESLSRSKYNRIEDDSNSLKIRQQTVASPIFFWKDADVWLYILSRQLDFNEAYRLGYDRVGCWCCPNNNLRAQFLSSIYMPERAQRWRNFLLDFARSLGKPDPETYVDNGKWKARQGGNGLRAADDIKIKFTGCTTEEHANIYQLSREFNDELIGMFVPFGRISTELGRKLLHETIVLSSSNVPIISIQPFDQVGVAHAVKIKTMNVADHKNLQRMISYQIKKFNACRQCLKCESICRAGAISVSRERYYIDPVKCVRCKACVSAKYLEGGCMMEKYLRTKKQEVAR
ncbi:MAG: phosphoadenosine phosphosulfate reductase family protein [Selenomonadaceae bacterium]|nr:phosphoadenosine phosphosulfate reductase family protein [Selenomonadaceae bacterium]